MRQHDVKVYEHYFEFAKKRVINRTTIHISPCPLLVSGFMSYKCSGQWLIQLHSHKTAASSVCKSTLIPTTLCSHMIISLISAVSLRIHVFWDMTPCCWVKSSCKLYVPSQLWKPLTQLHRMHSWNTKHTKFWNQGTYCTSA